MSRHAWFFLFKPEQLFHNWLLQSSRWTGCCNSDLLALDRSFTESLSEWMINNVLVPHLPGPRSVASQSRHSSYTFSCAWQGSHIYHSSKTICILLQRFPKKKKKKDNVPSVIMLLLLRPKSHHIQGWKLLRFSLISENVKYKTTINISENYILF